MTSRPYSRRNRIVTACRECHRRKQKCNRATPCNNCVARSIPGRCVYADTVSVPVNASQQVVTSSPSHDGFEESGNELFNSDLPPSPSSIVDQIGYSSKKESNALLDFQKSFHDGSGETPAAIQSSISPPAAGLGNKFKSLSAQLPPRPIMDKLVKVYFSEANWWFLVLEPHFFEKAHTAWISATEAATQERDTKYPSRDIQYFPALLFQVLALALQFLSPDSNVDRSLKLQSHSDCDALSRKYSTVGLQIMALLGRHNPTLNGVQHDILRAIWLKNCSRGTESWHCVGTAIRQAQELGLHLQSEVSQDSATSAEDVLNQLWGDEHRRRLWAILFVFDSHMALILGRPRTIHRDDCTVMPPIDCDIPEDTSKAVPAVPQGRQLPSSWTPQAFHYAIGHKIHDMLSSGAGKPHIKDYNKVITLHDQVIELIDALPPAMRPEGPDTSWDSMKPHFPKLRQHIASVASSFLMALHRPHVATHPESRRAAIRAALETLELQQRMFSLMSEHHYKIYGFSFYTIDAGIFLSAMVVDQLPHDPTLLEQAQCALQQAINRLALMKERSAVAISGEQILCHAHQRIEEASMEAASTVKQINMDLSEALEMQQMTNLPNSNYVQQPQNQGAHQFSNLFDAGQLLDAGAYQSTDLDMLFDTSFLQDPEFHLPTFDTNPMSNGSLCG